MFKLTRLINLEVPIRWSCLFSSSSALRGIQRHATGHEWTRNWLLSVLKRHQRERKKEKKKIQMYCIVLVNQNSSTDLEKLVWLAHVLSPYNLLGVRRCMISETKFWLCKQYFGRSLNVSLKKKWQKLECKEALVSLIHTICSQINSNKIKQFV